ncbi:DUF397 domain-containing protein [Actinomadura fibrosa]|uniref:DUF397 domain-containing protein n=1 Tax=Actinomadura fibrosa TaxID=111802 RepID=A0ABW2XEK3_9ACTN|nr:DUF397 domain-containing protein [Actinomadura fibrosa]
MTLPSCKNWRKSSYSAANSDCVEVGRSAEGMIGVRDTKQAVNGPVLHFSTREWSDFLRAVRSQTS